MANTLFTLVSEGADPGDLQRDLLSASDLEVRRVAAVPTADAKGSAEIALVVAAHVVTVGLIDLARILLTWIRRKPGAKLHVRNNDGTRSLTLDYETKLVSREEIEQLAARLKAVAGMVGDERR
jgi:hypothetical protein